MLKIVEVMANLLTQGRLNFTIKNVSTKLLAWNHVELSLQ
jgi:hypothetical protein